MCWPGEPNGRVDLLQAQSEATNRSFAAPAGRRARNRGKAGATHALMGAKIIWKASDKIILSASYQILACTCNFRDRRDVFRYWKNRFALSSPSGVE